MTPTRPVLRYHGGKWKLAPWIIEHLPPHRIYVELYAGAASVLMRKERSYAEVYNDIDGEVVNVFRILRDPARAEQLRARLELTPFAREEFVAAYEPALDEMDAAAKMITRAIMGFGSASMTGTHITGFRRNTRRSGTTPAHDWTTWPWQIPAFVDRLRAVVIENKAALEVFPDHDTPETLFYVDPPYPWSTRAALRGRANLGSKHGYRHEMSDDDHRRLAGALRAGRSMVVISGYACDLYDRELFHDWYRVERPALADGARPRTEVLWLNAAAANALEQRRAA